jgi:hypothetical protein
MAGFKLMNSISDHNTGQALDPSRFRIDQAQEQFGKMNKIGYNSSNFIADQTALQSNYGKLK